MLHTTSNASPFSESLKDLKTYADGLPNTRMLATAKVTAMVALNMRWERLMVDRELPESPLPQVAQLIADARSQLQAWAEAAFIEGDSPADLDGPADQMEERHHDLFQDLWMNFDESDYEDRIARYVHRLRINDLSGDFLAGRRCIDFGCGHGNFLHALIREGADSGVGIDYGEGSIRYAIAARDRLGVPERQLSFRVESVYEVEEPDESFDLALQNGVFHHLDDEDRAYREAHRVLRPGGWLWVYTDGQGAVSHELWDASVHILRGVPHGFILSVLDSLGVEVNKRYHLGDGLNAVYRHTTWEELTARMERLGFGEFRRLIGGFPTDFDHDVIEQDPYGVEKFGSGDLRLLAQKV